jgi:hypothetical protein
LDLLSAGNKTTLCKDESVLLTVNGTKAGDTIEWKVGETSIETNLSTFTLDYVNIRSSNVTVTVKVTKNGSDCFTEVSKNFIKIIISDPGVLDVNNTVICNPKFQILF